MAVCVSPNILGIILYSGGDTNIEVRVQTSYSGIGMFVVLLLCNGSFAASMGIFRFVQMLVVQSELHRTHYHVKCLHDHVLL